MPASCKSVSSFLVVGCTSTVEKRSQPTNDPDKRELHPPPIVWRGLLCFMQIAGYIVCPLVFPIGFDDNDAAALKTVLRKLFEGDASSARPDGSMAVDKVIWWQHDCKAGRHSSARVHRSLHVQPDGSFALDKLEGLEPEII